MNALALTLLGILLSVAVRSQPTLIRTFTSASYGNVIRLVATPDGGWAVYSPDSLSLAKFNRCGIREWSRHYDIGSARTQSTLEEIISLPGGFALLSRVETGGVHAALVIRLDDGGNVLWSKTYGDPFYSLYPYTLLLDPRGNLVITANAAPTSQGGSGMMVARVDPRTGALVAGWIHNIGNIWGGAVVTSDGGLLTRTGSRFVKTNAAGAVEWAVQVRAFDDYYYHSPIEVADGYIYTTVISPGANGEVCFNKLDRRGNLLWGGRKRLSYTGRPPVLRLTGRGTFVATFNRYVHGKPYPTIVEFDKELNPIRQQSLVIAGQRYGVDALCISGDGTPVLAGYVATKASGYFFAKTDSLLQIRCDTLLDAPTARVEPVSHAFIQVSTAPFGLGAADLPVRSTDIPLQLTTVCAIRPQLDLGPDTIVCPGTVLTLRNRRGGTFDRYLWSTGATTASIRVSRSGTYRLQVIANCDQDTLTDSVTLVAATLPAPAPASDTLLCRNSTVVLDATVAAPATYRWQDGSDGAQLTARDTGQYYVDITVGQCTRRVTYRVGECELLLLPNVFTPGSDGRNDRLVPIIMRGIGAATLEVYNRWGRKVYETTELRDRGWDGGGEANGTYFWLVRYTTFRGQQKTAKGFVELIAR